MAKVKLNLTLFSATTERILQTILVLTDTTRSRDANATFADERKINVTNVTLLDGDR